MTEYTPLQTVAIVILMGLCVLVGYRILQAIVGFLKALRSRRDD